MRSNPVHQLFFIFLLENISRTNLNLSSSYGHSTDLKSLLGLLLVSLSFVQKKTLKRSILVLVFLQNCFKVTYKSQSIPKFILY